MRRPVDAAAPVEIEGVQIWVDQVQPVAVLRRPGERDDTLCWPDLFTGWAEPKITVIAAPSGVWVHYGLLNGVGDDDPLVAFVNVVDAPAVHIDVATRSTSVVRVGRDQVLGATRHGLWTTGHFSPDPDFDNP